MRNPRIQSGSWLHSFLVALGFFMLGIAATAAFCAFVAGVFWVGEHHGWVLLVAVVVFLLGVFTYAIHDDAKAQRR
jgi:hypothetical protein